MRSDKTIARDSRDKALRKCFAALAEGDPSAIATAYDLAADNLFGYLVCLLRSRADAEDALQEVFLDVARHYRRFGRARRPWLYLLRATKNTASKVIKARARRSRMSAPEELRLLEARGAPAVNGCTGEISAALSKLPEGQREVVVLKIWQGLTFREIARVTGTTANTAASRYRYALEKLARHLSRNKKEESR